MNDAASPIEGSAATAGFTAEQKQYLQGFFAGAAQRMPFLGQNAAGQFTTGGGANLAASAPVETEPLFWGTPVSDLCAEEAWKYEANPLDAWDALLDHAAANKAPDAEHRYRFKSFGLFYVAPAQDSFMLRMRTPGGVMSTAHLRGLATMADDWGAKRLDLTTRANLQIRDFPPRHIVDVLNAVQRLGLTSKGTGADNLRNFTASPIGGNDPTELIDCRPYVDALQNYMNNARDLFGLPRKFNIAFDGGGSISTLADTNDIGFVAVRMSEGKSVPAGVYFRALLCGITGHRQFATDSGLLLLPEQLVAAAAAMVRVFAEHGDRTDRKKARLKYLIDRWGIPKFLEETQKKLAFPVILSDAAESEPRGPIDRAGHLGVHAQFQAGLHYIGVVTPVGWVPVQQARALATIADRFGSGEVRLTVWQNLLIPNIPTEHLEAAKAAIREAGLDFEAGRVLSGTVACTGSRGCRFAATDTKGHALELARALDAQFDIAQPLNLHVTGCNNSCAQHYIGDIGLMGVKFDGGEGYQVNLGGGADNEQGFARELYPALPYAQVLPALTGILRAFESNREADENFLAFTRRSDLADLRAVADAAIASEPEIGRMPAVALTAAGPAATNPGAVSA